MVNDKLSQLKSEFRAEAGKTLSTKLFKEVDHPIQHLSHNPSLYRALYKKSILVEITL